MRIFVGKNENGEEVYYDNDKYIEELKANHYCELKALIKRAIGDTRTQTEFAKEIGITKEYLSRLLKDGSDMLPSNKAMEKMASVSADKKVTFKTLMVAAGRTPGYEKDNADTEPNIITFDDRRENDIYCLKKDMVEFLIERRGDILDGDMDPISYTKKILSDFMYDERYCFFDFEAFATEDEYESTDDYGMDTISGEKRCSIADNWVVGYVTAAVRKSYIPHETWVTSKVTFALYFERDDVETTVIDTDWDIPEWVMDEHEYQQLEISNTYSLKEFLEKEDMTAYVAYDNHPDQK